MILNHLELVNVRNYASVAVDFHPGINVFIGANAQGKTSLVEAIYLLSLARSHRTSVEREVIRWHEETARIQGTLTNRYGELPLEISLTKQGKRVKVNHIEERRLSDYIGRLNVVLFAPEDLELVKGAPALRRRFIDMELSQMNAIYLHQSVVYQRILKQRNRYLKQLMKREATDEIYLSVLTEQLAKVGSDLLIHRLAFVKNLENWAAPLHETISEKKEELTLAYRTSITIDGNDDKDRIYQALLSKYEEIQEREIERGMTLIGPHRDDLSFYINGQDVQKYGSQGQQRTSVLSLKLAEIECMKESTQEYPVLLLDDVLSELDDDRQTYLLQSIQKKVQTFLTTTNLDGVKRDQIDAPHLFQIEAGTVQPL